MSDTPKQPGGDFTPNPLHSYGRLDTAFGEGGAQLHKIAPHVFPASESGEVVVEDPEASIESVTSEDGVSAGNPSDDNGTPDTGVAHDTQGVEGTVTNSRPDSAQTLVGGQPVEPVTGSGPSGEPLTEQPAPGTGAISDADAAAAAAGEPEGDGYDDLNVDALKEELHKRELTVGGNKPDLIARLREDDAKKAAEANQS